MACAALAILRLTLLLLLLGPAAEPPDADLLIPIIWACTPVRGGRGPIRPDELSLPLLLEPL